MTLLSFISVYHLT